MIQRSHRRRRQLLAVLLPERCVCCGEAVTPFESCCKKCRREIELICPPICTVCGMAKGDCRNDHHRHAFDRVAAPFYYEKSIRAAILRLKRTEDALAFEFLAEQMCVVARREYADARIDAVTFVPSDRRTLRRRGYNPSEELAREVAKKLELPLETFLRKTQETPPQKLLKSHERVGNVIGVFSGTSRKPVGRNILLIDDVLTTGATLNECAKILKMNGADGVYALTAALTRPVASDDTASHTDKM